MAATSIGIFITALIYLSCVDCGWREPTHLLLRG